MLDAILETCSLSSTSGGMTETNKDRASPLGLATVQPARDQDRRVFVRNPRGGVEGGVTCVVAGQSSLVEVRGAGGRGGLLERGRD
jgi:hypothetical protein